MEAWYERLKKRRKDLGLTQADIYRAVGVSNYTVSSWESGKHKPEGENLMALCNILGCDPDWLLTGKRNQQWRRRADDNKPCDFECNAVAPTAEDMKRMRMLDEIAKHDTEAIELAVQMLRMMKRKK